MELSSLVHDVPGRRECNDMRVAFEMDRYRHLFSILSLPGVVPEILVAATPLSRTILAVAKDFYSFSF